MHQESNLFQVKFTEQGKKFLRKFVAISYLIMGLVGFESCVTIYMEIKFLVLRYSVAATYSFYDKTYPYITIAFNIIAIISNIYYTRFPRVLLRSIEQNDEYGANKAFGILLKGAWIFLLWLILGAAQMIWSLFSR